MKTLIRTTIINSVSLFLLSTLFSGVIVIGGLATYLIAGVALSGINFFIKPVLHILTLPLRVITFGLFSIITNAVILYLLTVLVPNVKINAFLFPGVNLLGFIIPKMVFNTLFAYIICSFVLFCSVGFINWLFGK